ncbi:MAG: YicC family protein [Spartobacteria bacterium]|nr:YicC family protein [Spartobacteria bacterium]
MGIRSMTGYGQAAVSAEGVRAEIELSAVNRKQLDVRVSLPRDLVHLEPQIQEALQQLVSRGRVSVDVRMTYYGEQGRATVSVDQELAGAYVQGLRAAAKKLGLRDDLDASMLLKFPDVVRVEPRRMNHDKVWSVVSTALDKALKRLCRMRATEGKALQKDLEGRIKILESYMRSIRKQAPLVAAQYREQLLGRLADAGVEALVNDERLLKEVAIFADRADITEELTRLDSHMKQAKAVLKASKPGGRTLDFLAQEMFREINTIGSKGNDITILNNVVLFKTDLERFREQVQNVE